MANFAAGAIAGVSEILTFYPLGAYLIVPFRTYVTHARELSFPRNCLTY